MRSSFFGINVAQQGLFTSRNNMDVINHNISNSEVKGYSRQYTVQKAARPLRNLHRGMVGTGSEVLTVDQHRSSYLDLKYRSFKKDLGQYKTKSEFLAQLEAVFSEPYSNGLSKYLDELFTVLNKDLATDPTLEAARTNAVQKLKALTDTVNDTSKKIRLVQDDLNNEIKSVVGRINSYAEQLATINRQIQDLEIHGHKANDLRDQRNNFLDELSEIVPVKAREDIDALGQKTLHISINGAQLVNGPIATFLEVREREYLQNPEDNAGLYDIYWQTGQKMNVTANTFSGMLKGLIDLRDGANSLNFKGNVKSANNKELIIQNVNRFDLPKTGSVNIEGKELAYDSYTFNSETKEVTFLLKENAPNGLTGQHTHMGELSDFRGVPYYLGRLNEFSRIFAGKINELHQQGQKDTGLPLFVGAGNLNGQVEEVNGNQLVIYLEKDAPILEKGELTIVGKNIEYTAVSSPVEVTLPDGSKKMARTFTLKTPLDPTDPRAKKGNSIRVQDLNSDNITINPEIVADVQKLQTYYTDPKIGDVSNTDLLHDIISLRQDTKFFDRGTPDNFVQAYMGELGIDKGQATSFEKGSHDLIKMVDTQRMSFSGVNKDEEIAELTAYLQVYRYSAKAMDVFNRIYETTINLGR